VFVGLVPVLGVCHCRFGGRSGRQRRADLVRRCHGIVCGRTGLPGAARKFPRAVPYWPLALVAAPIAFAMLMNSGEYRVSALWLSLVLALWIALCARAVFQADKGNVAHIVSGLLAGIVFVDWLAVAPLCPRWLSCVFLILFGATLWDFSDSCRPPEICLLGAPKGAL
jgi:hypothetical protein